MVVSFALQLFFIINKTMSTVYKINELNRLIYFNTSGTFNLLH